MAGDRRARILDLLAVADPGDLATQHLCEVCAEATGMTGAGIMLMSQDLPAGWVSTTNPVSVLIEELQFTVGEGPCVDAYRLDRPVLEPNLSSPVTPRWHAFSGPVLAAGVRAIFGFPLRVGGARLGALNLYSDKTGPLTEDQYADALVMAEIAAQWVLMLQANPPPGGLMAELEGGGDSRLVVHQASGMVAVQMGESVASALVRLRGYAFGNNMALVDVAEAVVARTLRFNPHTEPS